MSDKVSAQVLLETDTKAGSACKSFIEVTSVKGQGKELEAGGAAFTPECKSDAGKETGTGRTGFGLRAAVLSQSGQAAAPARSLLEGPRVPPEGEGPSWTPGRAQPRGTGRAAPSATPAQCTPRGQRAGAGGARADSDRRGKWPLERRFPAGVQGPPRRCLRSSRLCRSMAGAPGCAHHGHRRRAPGRAGGGED